MATLYVSYFSEIDDGVAAGPIKTETVTTSGTSAATAAIPTNSIVALVRSDAAHYVTIGDGTPTADTKNSFYLPANETRPFRTYVATGQTVKIAAITA